MSSVQERLQLKRVPLDTWNIREKLFLASAVVRSGDQNWMSVSRALKTMGEPNRPPDWYSQKSCAAQYGALLEHVETPKRKKRNSEGGVETPQESILKRLMQQRIHEIQENLKEMNKQNDKLQSDIAELRNSSTPDERILEMYNDMESAKRAREKENARRAAWLKEREERRARAERPWRPTQTPPTTPTSAPPSSPLLTSLLKSSPVVTTPQHIPHPASVVDTISPSAGAPTLSLLLEQPHAQESKHAAIEHIKSQLVQIEHQLKASSQSSASVPAVDIDDIEIKEEDVYAFRDIDIHIPPVGTLHKANVRIKEKPTPKKEDEIIPEQDITEAVLADVKPEQVAEAIETEAMTATEVETIQVQEPPVQQTQIEMEIEEEPKPQTGPEAEIKIVFPEVKFPTPEIKVIQPDELKIKEEVKEPEVVQEQSDKEEKIEVPVVEEVIAEPTPTEEATVEKEEHAKEKPQPEAEPEPEIEVPPEPIPEPVPEPQEPPEVIETPPEVPDPQDIPLPDDEPVEQTLDIPLPDMPAQETQPEEEKHVEMKEETKEDVIVEEKKEEVVDNTEEDDKKDEDAEDSIPLKEMLREELAQEAKREEPIEEDTHTETDDDTPMELSREEEKDGKKRRDYSRKKKSDSRTCSGSESAPDSPSGTDAERQHRLWKKSVMLVYSRLCAHKYASLFLRPITDEEAPGYSVVVKKPMDLTQIRRDIDAGVVRSTSEFQRAVLLMLCNALMYNSSSHSVHAMAREMHEEAQCQLNMLVAAQAHAGLCTPRRKRRRYALD